MNIEYRIAETKEEFKKMAELCRDVFVDEPDVEYLVYDLTEKSPKKDNNIHFYAYDTEKEKVVSVVSLIDFPVKYGDINLKSMEIGIVATDENYRSINISTNLTNTLIKKGVKLGYNLMVIEGIPYFYRKYGFEYAVPLLVMEKFNMSYFIKERNNEIIIRKAELKDFDFIAEEYNDSIKNIEIASLKSIDIIKAHAFSYECHIKKDYFIVEYKGKIEGFFGIKQISEEIEITDISNNLINEIYDEIVLFLREKAEKENKKKILTVDVPGSSKFITFLKSIGSKTEGNYKWQIKIPDEFKFLNEIKSVLEKRILNSEYSNEDLEFIYNNYRQNIVFKIKNSKIELELKENKKLTWDFNLNPNGAIKLFLGDNSIEEISNFMPDCMVSSKYKRIVDIMFPKIESYFCQNY